MKLSKGQTHEILRLMEDYDADEAIVTGLHMRTVKVEILEADVAVVFDTEGNDLTTGVEPEPCMKEM